MNSALGLTVESISLVLVRRRIFVDVVRRLYSPFALADYWDRTLKRFQAETQHRPKRAAWRQSTPVGA